MNNEITQTMVNDRGNIKVILPWDGRVGELWDAGVTERGHKYGITGLNDDDVPAMMEVMCDWEYIVTMYAWHGKRIMEAPEGAEIGDIIR